MEACNGRLRVVPTRGEQIGDTPERTYQLLWLNVARQFECPLQGPRHSNVAGLGPAAPEHAGFVLRFCGTFLSLRHRYLGVVQSAGEWAVDGGHVVAATAGLREGVIDQDKQRTISRKNRDPVT